MNKKGQIEPITPSQVEQSGNINKSIILVVIIFVLLIIGGILIYFYISNGQQTPNNPNPAPSEKTTLTEIKTLDITPPEVSTIGKAESAIINNNCW